VTLEGLPEIAPDAEVIATAPEESDARHVRRARNLRRIVICALVGVLVIGVAGFLGVRSATTTATDNGYELRVTHPRVTRPGLAVPITIRVEHRGGFDGPIVIAQNVKYLDLFDLNGVYPDPDASTSNGEDVVFEFEPPDGDVFEVRFDTRTGPNVQWGKRGETSVLVGGEPVVTVSYRTLVMP